MNQQMQQMLKQAQEMQRKIADAQQSLADLEVEGSAGAGMVKVAVNGQSALKKVTISPELLKADDKEVLEDLIVAAYNDARSKAEAASSEKMGEATSGLPLPPGFKLPF